MSINVKAAPLAFLIAPEAVKTRLNISESISNKISDDISLEKIEIKTNLTNFEIKKLCTYATKTSLPNQYQLSSGLLVSIKPNGDYINLELSGLQDSDELKKEGEVFFDRLDEIYSRNVRLLNSHEYFLFYYDTKYTNASELYSMLKSHEANNIFSTPTGNVVATLKDGKSVTYVKNDTKGIYQLVDEHKIEIIDINVDNNSNSKSFEDNFKELSFSTNIKTNELRSLLTKANYSLIEANMNTPLKSPQVILNWQEKDGFYVAVFSGNTNIVISKEADKVFKNLNIAAGRDIRYINDFSTLVYKYKTNYTDKSVLLNTLIEHDATAIEDNGSLIKCSLYNMNMTYIFNEDLKCYELEINQISDKKLCEDMINDLNDEYALNVQDLTYKKIMARLEKENLKFESETVLDDNSIVLTIEV